MQSNAIVDTWTAGKAKAEDKSLAIVTGAISIIIGVSFNALLHNPQERVVEDPRVFVREGQGLLGFESSMSQRPVNG